MTTTPPVRPSTLTYSKTPPALPPADRSNKGALVVTVLSAYDLTCADQPLAVSMQVAGATARTGPPSARHKDRNSYRFVTSQVLRVDAPLSTLYKTKATFTLEYPNARQNLTAQLVCNSLKIHETQWLILNLEPMLASTSDKTTTTTSTSAGELDDDDDEDASITPPPTLRLQVRLEGPYRTEIATLVSACNAWFRTVDSATNATSQVTRNLPSFPVDRKYLLIPGVPIMTAAVVLSPILVGICIVGLPVFLPILVAVVGVLLGVGVVGGILAASTKTGRKSIAKMCSPVFNTLLSTPSGQCLMYETGPRPTPVSIARAILPTDLWGKLAVSLFIDAIGSASYLIPVVGEVMDVAWAPIQVVLIMAMYDTVSPNLKYVSFVEEILPLTDVVPSATIGWATEFGPQLLPAVLGGGANSNAGTTEAVTQLVASLTNPSTTSMTTSMNSRTSIMNGTVAPARASSVKQS